jgi:hypothetical protein
MVLSVDYGWRIGGFDDSPFNVEGKPSWMASIEPSLYFVKRLLGLSNNAQDRTKK